MKKRLIWGVLIFGLVVVGLWLFYPHLVDIAIKHQAMSFVERLQTSLLIDGRLHVIVVGSGAPVPDPYRVQACVAVIVDGAFLLFDTGGASAQRLDILGLPTLELNGVFFTHLHSDHIADLPLVANLSWRYGRRQSLAVYGPTGTEAVVNGFNQAHRPDIGFRYENTKAFRAPPDVALPIGHDIASPGKENRALVYEGQNGIRVYAFLVDHQPVEPAFGYRIEYQGHILVISGDTRRCENVARHAQDADLLIHSAFNKKLIDRMLDLTPIALQNTPQGKRMVEEARQLRDHLASPVDVADIAAKANVHALIFTHVIPPLGNRIARFLITESFLMDRVKDRFTGKVIIAEDGTHLTL
jgi:ribonuclease Z